MDLDIIHTILNMEEAPSTPSYSGYTRRGSPGCSSEPCAICCRTSCCGRGRAPGPIRGEHWCHVTRSPPITAHLGSCLGPLCSSAMTSLVPPDCTAMVLRVVVSLLSVAAAAVPTPVFILPEGVH